MSTPEEAILTTLQLSGKTISYAESCTGGALVARLTRLPGASKVFLGGVVAYHNAVKEQLLGVNASTLSQYGAVSEQVVKEMAQGILRLTGSDYSLAVSGIAGPDGGTADKPVGTVWGAIGYRDGQTHTKLFKLQGSREGIIASACNALMGEFLLFLKD